MNHYANRRRRLVIALGAGTLTDGLNIGLTGELFGGIAAHAQGSGPPAFSRWKLCVSSLFMACWGPLVRGLKLEPDC